MSEAIKGAIPGVDGETYNNLVAAFSEVPSKKYQVKGASWTLEALIIVGLMRKLGVSKMKMSELDIAVPKGMILTDTEIDLQEFEDGKKEENLGS